MHEKPSAWTPEEKSALFAAVEQCRAPDGQLDWGTIAATVPGRSAHAVEDAAWQRSCTASRRDARRPAGDGGPRPASRLRARCANHRQADRIRERAGAGDANVQPQRRGGRAAGRGRLWHTGRLLTPSMPESSSARPALPPQPSCRIFSMMSRSSVTAGTGMCVSEIMRILPQRSHPMRRNHELLRQPPARCFSSRN